MSPAGLTDGTFSCYHIGKISCSEIKAMSIILASASPRRRELMKLITEDFIVRSAPVDEREIEKKCAGMTPEQTAIFLATKKAEAIVAEEGDIVIGADTSVVTEDKILGKPKDREEAYEMLSSLAGRTHSVITGVCILKGEEMRCFSEETLVEFMPRDGFMEDLIGRYVDSKEPYDKAGAYGIQGGGALLVRKINGDYFNVVGLPVAGLARELAELI